MKLGDLKRIILPFQRVLIYDTEMNEGTLDDGGLECILFSGYWCESWYKNQYMKCDVLSIYEVRYDYSDVIVLEIDYVSDIHEDALQDS